MNIDPLKVYASPSKFFNSFIPKPFASAEIVDEPIRITKSSSSIFSIMLTTNFENMKVLDVVTSKVSGHFFNLQNSCNTATYFPSYKPFK